MKRRPLKQRRPTTPPPAPAGVPASVDIEYAALGCVFMAADDGSMGQVDALLGQLSLRLFEDGTARMAFESAQQIRAGGNHLDPLVWRSWCSCRPEWSGYNPDLVWSWRDLTPTPWNFPTYLTSLQEASTRRFLRAKGSELSDLANGQDVSLDTIRGRLAELLDNTAKAGRGKARRLEIESPKSLLAYNPPTDSCLVGDNEIRTGYEGICLLAGPGSSGKSLAVASLALAGARGDGLWMGRKVHRRFRTMIIQAENGATRLKKEVSAMTEKHPEIDLEGWVFWSRPPEGGIPFHSPEFRQAVKRAVDDIKPDLVVLDPWSHVAADDSSKDVMDKLAEVRSCFPPGDDSPGLLIVAHTKKPRAEEIRPGRGMVNQVSGSVALANTARCVYVLLPFSDDQEDNRILWCCPKLNDGQMYGNSVWFRRFGSFFEHDAKTDPKSWGVTSDEPSGVWLTVDMVRQVLQDSPALTQNKLAETLAKWFHDGRGASSVHKWLKRPEYSKHLSVQSGLISWKD